MMRNTLGVCGLLFLVLAPFGSPAVGADSPQQDNDAAGKQRDIRKLLDLTGSGKLGVQVAGQMIDQFRSTFPNVPPEFWDEIKKEIKSDELTELVVPVYDQHFSHDDINELIKFYESPIGRKLTAALPQITREAMVAGQQWGQNLARRVQQRLKEKGYIQA